MGYDWKDFEGDIKGYIDELFDVQKLFLNALWKQTNRQVRHQFQGIVVDGVNRAEDKFIPIGVDAIKDLLAKFAPNIALSKEQLEEMAHTIWWKAIDKIQDEIGIKWIKDN